MPKADRRADGIGAVRRGVQGGIFTEAKEIKRPFAQTGFLGAARCRCYGERLLRCRACDGDDRLLPRRELDGHRAAYLLRLLQIEEEVVVAMTTEGVLMPQIGQHIALIRETGVLGVYPTPKGGASFRHGEGECLTDKDIGTK